MRQRRVEAVRQFIKSRVRWDKVIFSDEKYFTVNGSDTFYSWLRKNQSPRRVKQIVRSPGLMVWAMIMPNGLLSYEIMKGRQNSEKYMDLIKTKALPIIKVNNKVDYIFQHDNCRIHI